MLAILALICALLGTVVIPLGLGRPLRAARTEYPRIEETAGTLPTHGPLFIALLIGTVVLVGALTYVPALALGPVIEQLQLYKIH